MPRPRLCRNIHRNPEVSYFKPQGVPLRNLAEVVITLDAYEAMRLADLEGLSQEDAAKKMGISQPTFHRLLVDARKKIAESIVQGKALKIEGGPVRFRCRHRGRRDE